MKKDCFRKEVLEASGYFLPEAEDLVKLDQNELPYDLPEPVKDQMLGALKCIEWNRYPRFTNPGLRKKLSSSLNWPADGIVVANGSNVLIQAIIIASALGRSLVTVKPTFGLYRSEAQLLGCKVEEVAFDDGYQFPLKKVLDAIKKVDAPLAIFANPNAQTGTLVELESLLEVVKKAPGLVVVDEAYFEFCGQTLLGKLKNNKNLILLRTFSKAFGLGGVRVGYLLAAPEVASVVQKAVLPFCLNSLSEAIATIMLDHQDLISERAKHIVEERGTLYSGMNHIEGVKVVPSMTNFLLFKIKGLKASEVYEKIAGKGYAVRDISDDEQLSDCLRVSVGTPEHNKGFLKALRELLR